MAFHITGDPAADQVLDEHPFGLLTGMLLDQQFPMERAFAGPSKILDRFGSLAPEAIAEADPEAFVELCARPPAIHRFPGAMAARVQALAAHVVDVYGGRTEALWLEARDGRELLKRVQALPGFGQQKARIFVALLGKRAGVRPQGWAEAAGDYAEPGSHRSVADVVDEESLARVRAFKKEKKAAARA
jgi:uncharacterized HhH-GPD family protein